MTKPIRSALAQIYLHRLPDFRGKWKLLALLSYWFDGVPVRARHAEALIALDLHDRTNRLGVMGGYDSTVADAIATLPAGGCFVDVGANCGLFTLQAAQRVGAGGLVIAFEPCFDTFAKLVNNIDLNRLKNVLPLNLAVAAIDGPATLDRASRGHSGRYAVATGAVDDSEAIHALTIDGFPALLRMIGERPILVKVDVEGFEVSALRGLRLLLGCSQTLGVVVEVDPRNLGRYGATPADLFALLEEHGFRQSGTAGGEHFDAVFTRPVDPQASVDAPAAAHRGQAGPQSGRISSIASHRPPVMARLVHSGAARIAAALLLLVGFWSVSGLGSVNGAEPEDYFINEALQSHNTAQMRAQLRRSPPTRFNVRELGSATRIALPILPNGWRVTDVQLFPSDSGPSLQVTITNGHHLAVSLFAVRDDNVASIQPSVVRRGAASVASWQEGDLAYALTSNAPPAELHRIAEDMADNDDGGLPSGI